MRFLKGLALGLVIFFLAVSLFLLGPLIILNNTVLNADFTRSEIDRLNVTEIARSYLRDNIPPDYASYAGILDATIEENKDWIDLQIAGIVDEFFNYINGQSEDIAISIDLAPVRASLEEKFKVEFQKQAADELAGLSESEKQELINQKVAEFMQDYPTTLDVTRADLPEEAANALQQVKEAAGYLKTAYIVLIIACLVLIGLVILIFRNIKGPTLTLGLVFSIEGVLGMISYIVGRSLISTAIPLADVPAEMHDWLITFAQNIISPWGIYLIVMLVVGLALLVVYFVFRNSRQQLPAGASPADTDVDTESGNGQS
jgi:hypothetical protein